MGGHHAQEEHREGQDVAVADAPAHGEVDGQGQHHQMEEAFRQRLGRAEEGHRDVVAQFRGAALLGRLRNAIHLLGVGVGDADVLEPPELFDHRPVELLAASQQAQAHPPLRPQLPGRQRHRGRDDANHDQPDPGLLDRHRPQREQARENGRKEVEERQPQQAHVSVDAAEDTAVQHAHLLVGERGQVHLQQVGHHFHAQVLVDARAGVLDEKSADDVQALAQEDQEGDGEQIVGCEAEERIVGKLLLTALLDLIHEVAEQEWDRRGGDAGECHEDGCPAERPAVARGDHLPNLHGAFAEQPDLVRQPVPGAGGLSGHGQSFGRHAPSFSEDGACLRAVGYGPGRGWDVRRNARGMMAPTRRGAGGLNTARAGGRSAARSPAKALS